MSELNRRDFLFKAAATAVVISLPVLQANADDSTPTSKPSIGPVDVGPLKSFDKDGASDKWVHKSKFFVIREDNKLYASSATCTHRGATLTLTDTDLFCPRHKSHFSFQGTVTDGPAKQSLARYAISTDPQGNVLVDKSTSFSEAHWDDPASFIDLSKT